MADVFAHDTWLYGPEAPAGRLFLAGEPVPSIGWHDAPQAGHDTTNGDKKDAMIAALRSEVAKMDPDGDGRIGGATASPDKEALVKALTEAGVEFDGRLGPTKLQALLDEHNAKTGQG